MKSLSPNMTALLAGDSIGALAEFWTLTRVDGTVFNFTNWDTDVGIYKTASGWTRSAVQDKVELAPGNQEITGIAIDPYVTEADVRAGLFDGSTIEHFYAVPTDNSFLTYGRIYLPTHYISEVKLIDGIYVLECRGYTYPLQSNLIDLFGPLCRADFADKNGANKCKLDPLDFTITGSALSPSSKYNSGYNQFSFTPITGTMGENWKWGTVIWDTGANAGLQMEISDVDITSTPLLPRIVLYVGMPFAIVDGDTFHAVAGCAKTNVACKFYGNIANMRGEPFIPGMNLIFDYGSTG